MNSRSRTTHRGGDRWDVRSNLRENGATGEEVEVLLHQRVELNAFTSDKLIEWIEAKLAEHGISKVVPGDNWLEAAYRTAIAEAHFDSRSDQLFEEANEKGNDATIPQDLKKRVRQRLKEHPDISWDQAVRRIALADYVEDEDGEEE